MAIPEAILTESPLPDYTGESAAREEQKCYEQQDVKIEDILNVPSLSVSLRTATDCGAYFDEGNSFFRSEEKSIVLRKPAVRQSNVNDSIVNQDEASMIKEEEENQEEYSEREFTEEAGDNTESEECYTLNTKGDADPINIIDCDGEMVSN